MNSATPRSLLKLLLALCSAFATLAAVLGVYVYRTHHRTRVLQAELAQKVDLQRRLMELVPSDHCLYPHFKSSIGYVFNPFMKEGTLWGPRDQPYAINPLGLRGPGIGETAPGRKRIVLLGDSWFFGWKLRDEDKLESHLRGLLKDIPYDVVTVAIPGWNVRSEAAFLKSHMRYLDPDVVIWEVCPNDTWDVGAVIPPGSLSWTISPQNREPENNAFTVINGGLPALPFLLRRQRENLELIREVRRLYGVPVLVAPAGIPPAVWSLITEGSGADLPARFFPPAYGRDARARLSNTDPHPTAWMNHRLAVGYAGQLADMNLLPPRAFDPGDQAILQEWRSASPAALTRAEIDRTLLGLTSTLPADYATDADFQIIAAGMMEGGRMARHGLLHLRIPPGRSAIRVEFEAADYAPSFPREVKLAARNFENRETAITRGFSGAPQRVSCDLPLPSGTSRYPAYEIEWWFNYDECDYPTRCYSARLAGVSSH